jgi:hypothetical protein
MKRVFLFLILGLACTIGMTSCSEEDKEPGNVPLTEITVPEGVWEEDGTAISLDVRYSEAFRNIKFAPVPANATDVNFKLTSADPSVATVLETALGAAQITVLKPGSTVVTISSGNVKKEIPVIGRFDVTLVDTIRLEFEIVPESGTDSTLTFVVPVGDVVQVKASPHPQNANTATVDYVIFDWKSNNPNVATIVEDAKTTTAVDKIGTITVVGTGEAWITISCEIEKDDEDGKKVKEIKKAKYIVIKGIAAE